MDEEEIQAKFDLFGLSIDASIDELERSFRELCALYSERSLATYSLLDETERKEKIKSLHNAYNQILQFRRHSTFVVKDLEAEKEIHAPAPESICIDVDMQQMPGLFLQQSRRAKGLTLQDVAERTKVGLHLLQSIEEQHYDILPVSVYLRGFLKQFARMVNVPDVEALVDSYMALYHSYKALEEN
jgi:cytoskeleton protein RodZ